MTSVVVKPIGTAAGKTPLKDKSKRRRARDDRQSRDPFTGGRPA
jgi:hypothetical protein